MGIASTTNMLLWLFLLCNFEHNFARRNEKSLINGNLLFKTRHKRQAASTGMCTRDESYPCTQTINEPYNTYCYFNIPCVLTRQRVVTTTCNRQINVCCDGYTAVGGQCIFLPEACRNKVTILTSKSGVIQSPNYPNYYPNNLNCRWEIRSSIKAKIEVKVTFLNLENPQPRCYYYGCVSVCDADRLTISDGNITWTLCGSPNIPLYSTTKNSVALSFSSNSYQSYFGFRLTYNIKESKTHQVTTPMPTTTTSAITTSTSTTTSTTSTTTSTTFTTPPTTLRPNTTLLLSTTLRSTIAPKSLPTTESTYNNSGVNNTTSPATTTKPDLSHIFNCRGDQFFSFNAPLCEKYCTNGTVESTLCGPQYSTYARPGCMCPSNLPVLHGNSCISESKCEGPRRPRCFGGTIYTKCMPTCVLTCKNYKTVPESCKQPPRHCLTGCTCPSSRPALHGGLCMPVALCPKPKPLVVKCGTQYHQPNVRIVGGKTALQGSWPWAVQIIKGIPPNIKFQCGGTVICANWVLTAAHCFQAAGGHGLETETYIYKVRIGKHARSDIVSKNIIIQTPQQIIVHPRYNSRTVSNDLALIRLAKPLKMSRTIRPACLPEYSPPQNYRTWLPQIGTRCYVIGWGETKNKGPTNKYLKQAQITVRQSSSCNVYTRFDATASLCVGGYTYADACTGDSGGPLLCKHGDRWYVDGITSYGLQCGIVGEPGVYTRVTSYSDWIRNYTGNNCGHPNTTWAHA